MRQKQAYVLAGAAVAALVLLGLLSLTFPDFAGGDGRNALAGGGRACEKALAVPRPAVW